MILDDMTGEVIESPAGLDIVPLNIGALDPDQLAQWTPTPEQITVALTIARAKNISAPRALDKYRRELVEANREKKIALGLAVRKLRDEFGPKVTMTELKDLAFGVDDRLIAAADAADEAWLMLEYAKDFAEAIERDVTLLQSIAKTLRGDHS